MNTSIHKRRILLDYYLHFFFQAGNTTSMWSMDSDGDQTGFQEGQIAYYTSTSYEIIIELFTKGDARGYIILDDVSFLPSYCEGMVPSLF